MLVPSLFFTPVAVEPSGDFGPGSVTVLRNWVAAVFDSACMGMQRGPECGIGAGHN